MRNLREVYAKELATGKVVITDSFKNDNSTKDQIAVTFAQMVEKPNVAANAFLAIEQGTEAFGKTIITTVRSYKREQAEKLGLYPFKGGLFAEKLYGKCGISVIENTVKNPLSPSQTPITNPTTGEICTSNGLPVYRHTVLSPEHLVKREFSTFDKTTVAVENAISRIAEPIVD